MQEEWQRVERILEQLTENYAYSPQANCRKGGLLALAAAAVAITERKLVCTTSSNLCPRACQLMNLITCKIITNYKMRMQPVQQG